MNHLGIPLLKSDGTIVWPHREVAIGFTVEKAFAMAAWLKRRELARKARSAPPWRLRYRWALRRRAPAWRQRWLKGWRWACDRCGAMNTNRWPSPCTECGELQVRPRPAARQSRAMMPGLDFATANDVAARGAAFEAAAR